MPSRRRALIFGPFSSAGGALALVLLGLPLLAPGRAFAQTSAGDCVPLEQRYPDLGTSQSASAVREFKTWGSY
jgi:hypothetical protein